MVRRTRTWLRDAYTFDTTAVDSDGDGYLDNTDDCPSSFGNSTNDRIGCIDSDGDGYSDADETWSVEMELMLSMKTHPNGAISMVTGLGNFQGMSMIVP